MENNLVTFTNEELGNVRVIEINGEPWFVGKDVAKILGYGNTRDAMAKHVFEEDKMDGVAIRDSMGREQTPVLINESGLYSLILSSKIPGAKKFKHWVTAEVIPSIRKNGVYATDITLEKMIADPDFAIGLLTELKNQKEENKRLREENIIQSQQIAELNPKATYYDEVLKCEDAVPVTVIAKDYGMSPQQLNNYLHDKKVQYYVGGTWVLYKQHQDKGYTKTDTYWYKGFGGKNYSNIQTKWTQKGRLFIYELMKRNGKLPLIEQE